MARSLSHHLLSQRAPAIVVGALLAEAVVAVTLASRGASLAIVMALLPVLLVVIGALVVSDRAVLAFGALALGMTFNALNKPISLGGAGSLYTADVLVLLAIGAWAIRRLCGFAGRSGASGVRSGVLGRMYVVFALLTLVAAFRGHELYGARLVGQPLRLVAYAGIAFALCELDTRKAWRGITAIYYLGTVWMLLNAVFLIVTGGSQTTSGQLSTGGTRVLAIGTSFHLAGALFLALLNLQLDTSARRRSMHLAVAGLATLGIILAFSRGTFATTLLLVFILMIAFRHVRESVVGLAPVAIPFIVVAALAVSQMVPTIGPTLISRINVARVQQGADASAEWRARASGEILAQVRESPVFGVGFGKGGEFTLNKVEFKITQNAHDSYLWLLAGGGAVLLASFLSLLLLYLRDARRRYQAATEGHERVIVVWSALTLFTFLLNAIVGPVFTDPTPILVIWVLLLLPSIVPLTRTDGSGVAVDSGRGEVGRNV